MNAPFLGADPGHHVLHTRTVFVAIFGSLAFTWLPQRRECPSIADVTGHLFPLPVPSPGH